MRRTVAIAVSIMAGLAMLGVAFFLSPAARRVVGDFTEHELAEALGGSVEIGSVTGSLFHEFQLRDIRLRDAATEWGRIDHVELRWSPGGLARGKIEIESIIVENTRIIATPPKRERRRPFKGLELPDSLPALSIGGIEIRNLVIGETIVAKPIRLDGAGRIDMGGRRLLIETAIRSEDNLDDVSIRIDRDPVGRRLIVDARITSDRAGALATLFRADGPIDLSAAGEGSSEDYRLAFQCACGDAGAIDGAVSGDLTTLETIGFSLKAHPGARFDRWRRETGDSIAAEGILQLAARGGRLDPFTVRAASGAVSATLDWRNSFAALEKATLVLHANFAEGWRPDLQRAVGDKIDGEIQLAQGKGGYQLDVRARSPLLALETLQARTDLRSFFEGKVTLSASENGGMTAALGSSLNAQGFAKVDIGNSLSIDKIDVRSASGARLAGTLAYDLAQARAKASGALTLPESAVAAVLPAVRARGNFVTDFGLDITSDKFTVRLTATTPALTVNNALFPPARVAVSAAGSPFSPQGQLSVRALDESRRIGANFALSEAGLWRIRDLDYRGDGFLLSGALAFNLEAREAELDIAYRGARNAEPWPGVRLEGEASATGALRRERSNNLLAFSVASVHSSSFSAEDFYFEVRGGYQNPSFAIKSGSIEINDRFHFKDLHLAGTTGDLSNPSFSILSAAADLNGSPVSALRPAFLDLGDGLRLRNLKLSIGDKGIAELEGEFSASRWRAVANLDHIQSQNGVSSISASLDLDTDRTQVAAGRLEIASTLTNAETIKLPGEISWDGRRLRVRADGAGGLLQADLSIPMRLKRAERLGVDFRGPLGGAARYQGRAESLSLFLPPALQSVEGSVEFFGSLGGTSENPRIDGVLKLIDGSYTDLTSGLSIIDIDLKAAAAADSATSRVEFSATATGAGQAGKSISATGGLEFRDGLELTIELTLDRAQFAAGPVKRADASGKIEVNGKPEDLRVKGDVEVHALVAELFTPPDIGLVDIDVVAVNGDARNDGGAAENSSASSSSPSIRYDISVVADDNVAIRGRGLNSEWRADVKMVGGDARPLIIGALNLRRGELEFAGDRFNLTRGLIGFDMLAPNDPIIELRAERETREGVTVAVVVEGRSSAMKVSLESTPAKPMEDIMALVLFKKPATELTAFESLQVADALTQLGGVGVFGGKSVAGAVRDTLGLDLLNLQLDEDDTSSSLLTVGKYVADGLFVSVSQNARGENGSLRIEYEIGRSFSLETELRQDGDQTMSANWKKDF